MKRLILFGWFLSGALALSPIAAPVPKQKPPEKPTKITSALLAGTWQYEWSSMLGGWITFTTDGSYTAQHYPDSTTVYSGSFSIHENSITIVEYRTDTVTGVGGGPILYRFDVETLKDWPTLPGASTGGFAFDSPVIPRADVHLKFCRKP